MDRVCRICLNEDTDLSSIFSSTQEVNDLTGLPQKIQVCGSIEIHEQDGLPSLICGVCIYRANIAHEFRQQCQDSDARLRMYYNKPVKCIKPTTVKTSFYQVIFPVYRNSICKRNVNFSGFSGFLYADRFTNKIYTIEKVRPFPGELF